ncbi:MAG: hypothetical protein HFI75_01360 [Lachnospiraceae bacterium]|nr:hypothetical protein [Lachnospiraceae bacterium]
MLKIAGSVMIFTACLAMGVGKGKEYKRRIGELLLVKRLLLMLRGEVKYARTPLPEAFQTIGKKMENVFGTFLLRVAEELNQQEGETLQQVWEKNLDQVLDKSALTREDRQQLKKLGSQLGYLDQEMQISTIDFQVEQLEGQIKRLEEEQGKRSRVCSCLGIFAGVMLNLILL